MRLPCEPSSGSFLWSLDSFLSPSFRSWAFSAIITRCVIFYPKSSCIYDQATLQVRADNVTNLVWKINVVSALSKTILLTLVITQAATMLVTGVLLAVVSYKLSKIGGKVRGMRDLLARLIGLIIALLVGIPNLALLAVVTVILGWIQSGTIPSFWRSNYATNIAFLWLIWAEILTEVIWICAISYAMRTVVKKSWLVANFKSILGLQSNSRGSGGTLSSGSGSYNSSTSMGTTFKDED